MPFLVVPNEVSATSANVWIAAVNEQFDAASATLTCAGTLQPLDADWLDFTTADGSNRIRYRRVMVKNLRPGTPHALVFSAGGRVRAGGTAATLPDRLPVAGERPFTVLLGSCFFGREDRNGAVGRTYFNLPAASKPDIKILSGDQVYLDNPPHHFLIPRGRDWLESRSFKTYADTWTQATAAGGGFSELLRRNANFFSSDDHEFWNNAPDVGLNVPIFTATQRQRDAWLAIARELYRIFQTSPRPPMQFGVGPLSFCIADTRFFRAPGASQFMSPADLTSVGDWAGQLRGPGVLVLGQPLLDGPGSIKDRGLPDSPQYAVLLRSLRKSHHTIVILTGDVHFGRVSIADLRPELGAKLIEVISSPMQLVPFGGGTYSVAPDVFGGARSLPEFSRGRNHFLTLEFTAPSASRASMTVRMWPIANNGRPRPELAAGPFELI